MTRKNYSMIPVTVAIIMIPQFLFWWLTPVTAAARLAVYIGGTALTIGIPLAYLMTYWKSNLRKSTGLLVVCSVLEIVVVALSTLLIGINISVRSAVFAFIITTLVYLIVLIPLISDTLKQQRQGVYSTSIPAEPISQSVRDTQNCIDRTPDDQQSHSVIPSNMSHQIPTRKPLPPRNR